MYKFLKPERVATVKNSHSLKMITYTLLIVLNYWT